MPKFRKCQKFAECSKFWQLFAIFEIEALCPLNPNSISMYSISKYVIQLVIVMLHTACVHNIIGIECITQLCISYSKIICDTIRVATYSEVIMSCQLLTWIIFIAFKR